MKRVRFKQKLVHRNVFFLASLLYTIASPAQAQSEGFADDFSVDSTRYSNRSFDDSSSVRSTSYIDGAIKLSSTGNESGPGSNNIEFSSVTDRLAANVLLSSETELAQVDEYSGASFFIQGFFFNDTFSPDQQVDETGEVMATITFGVDQFGSTAADYCLTRILEGGSFDNLDRPGANFCGRISGSESLQLDTRYDVELQVDRTAKTIELSIGGFSRVIEWPGEMYPSGKIEQRIQMWQAGTPGTAVGSIYSIATDEFDDDFSQGEPILGRYQRSNSNVNRSIRWSDERLTFSTTGTADNDSFIDLRPIDATDYIESTIEISSDSNIEQVGARSGAGLELALYNETSSNRFDEQEGDIRATLAFDAGADGLRRIEYCLVLYGQDRNREGLLDDGRSCQNMSARIEFDKAYRTAIELDRDQAVFRFRLNGLTEEVPVSADLLAPAGRESRVLSYARRNSSAVVFVDDFRTAPNAPTGSEAAAGAVDAPAFPDPVSAEELQVDSTVRNPYDFNNNEPRLDFVDDFSGPSSDFGFWAGRQRGDSGVYWQDGAIVLETNSVGDVDGNYTEFYLDPKTDNIEAEVSLSSRTSLPPTNDTGAEIQIRAIFYNDTQDYGFDGELGDMEASVRISLGSDGRRRFRANLRRRDTDGRTQDDVLSDIQELQDGLLSAIPELDQSYRLRLTIDRENRILSFGIDDEVFDYQIPTGVFLPYQRRVLISVNHRGPSGLAVGRIVSVETDTISEDFSASAPVLAPYRPNFSAQRPGRSVEVVDGRLRLEADGTVSSGNDPRIVALGASDYVGATLELSSESSVIPDGEIFVDVGGTLYNDLLPDARDPETPNVGNVFASVRLTAEGDGSLYAQYCAFRVDTQDFNELTELLGDNAGNCPRFESPLVYDSAYPSFVKLDRTEATLTFGFNGEERVYNISSDISSTAPFNGVRARTSDGSKVVAWADDLAFSENPVPLAMSDTQLITVVEGSATPVDDGTNATGGGTDENETPTTDSAASSGSGGGGCSVSMNRGGVDPSLLLLLLIATFMWGRRFKAKG